MKRLLLAFALLLAQPSYAVDGALLTVTKFLPGVVFQSIFEEAPEDRHVDKPEATVTAAGFGETCDGALENAKKIAVEKVNGAWISGDRHVRDNLFSERISEYNGGLIRSYKVLRNDCTHVIIEAKVVPRSNRVHTNSGNVPKEVRTHLESRIENEKKLAQSVSYVDDRSSALAFDFDNVEYKPNNHTTKVVIDGKVYFQEKWVHDYFELNKQAYQKPQLNSFYKPLYVNVKGYDYGKEVFDVTFRFYDDLQIYHIRPQGVIIYPRRANEVRLNFNVPNDIVKNITQYKVVFK